MKADEIRKIMADVSIDADFRLRALANYQDWFLVADKTNCAVLWTFDSLQTIAVMSERQSPDNQERQFLPMRGRHLMANLPTETQMIVFDLGEPHALCLKEGGIERLKNIANALSCEEQLAAPVVPGTIADLTEDVQNILSLEWTVLWNKDRPLVMDYKGLKGVMLFSACDTIESFLDRQAALRQSEHIQNNHEQFELAHMPGEKLFRLLDAQEDFDGVYINACTDLELYPFAPAQIHALAEGRQPRAERRILKARSQAELDHYLDECGMVAERPHNLEKVNGQDVVHYTGKIMPGLEQRTLHFYSIEENETVDGQWGGGASEIVCAGRLAELIRRRLQILADENGTLSSQLQNFVQSTRVWINELDKFIDPQKRSLPRRALRTVDGARFVREHPELVTTKFIEHARKVLQALQPT